MDSRVIKPKTPASLVVAAVLIGLLVLGFILFSTSWSFRGLKEARMTGTIVHKEFLPATDHERQIRLGRDGSISARDIEGQFILTVEVPQGDGTKKPFKVFMPDRKSYEAVSEGDSFDVGPYLIP